MSIKERKSMKQMIDNNELVFGVSVTIPNPMIAEIAGACGCDFIRIDAEHGLFDLETIGNFVRAADSVGISVIVRVPNISIITALLDFGVAGIIVPHMSSAAQAREAVSMTKYHPLGQRGMYHFGRAQRYDSIPINEYMEQADNETLLIVQIEDKEGIANMNEIFSVPGIDLIDTGKGDLSQALGIPGQMSDLRVIETENKILQEARKAGLSTFLPIGNLEKAKELINKGSRIFTVATDVTILIDGFKKSFEKVQELR